MNRFNMCMKTTILCKTFITLVARKFYALMKRLHMFVKTSILFKTLIT